MKSINPPPNHSIPSVRIVEQMESKVRILSTVTTLENGFEHVTSRIIISESDDSAVRLKKYISVHRQCMSNVNSSPEALKGMPSFDQPIGKTIWASPTLDRFENQNPIKVPTVHLFNGHQNLARFSVFFWDDKTQRSVITDGNKKNIVPSYIFKTYFFDYCNLLKPGFDAGLYRPTDRKAQKCLIFDNETKDVYSGDYGSSQALVKAQHFTWIPESFDIDDWIKVDTDNLLSGWGEQNESGIEESKNENGIVKFHKLQYWINSELAMGRRIYPSLLK